MKEKYKTILWVLFLVLFFIFFSTFVFWWRWSRGSACGISFPGVTREDLPATYYLKCNWYFSVDGFMHTYFGTEKHTRPSEVPFTTPDLEKL